MTPLAWLIGGLMLGGTVATVVLCCLQYDRITEYECEIRRLRELLQK